MNLLTPLQSVGDFKMNKDGLGWRSKEGSSITVVNSEIAAAKWMRVGRYFQLRLEGKNGTTYKFDGFREQVSCENNFFPLSRRLTNPAMTVIDILYLRISSSLNSLSVFLDCCRFSWI